MMGTLLIVAEVVVQLVIVFAVVFKTCKVGK